MKRYSLWSVCGGSTAVVAMSAALLANWQARSAYVAHEWGTFTSVQGGDGALLEWSPLASSKLPHFVYDWSHPGLGRQPTSQLLVGKARMQTLQRMETPVIYFYSEKPQTVDVSVQFPHGSLTEWYPQADQIGPCTVPAPPLVAKLNDYVHRVGVRPGFTWASFLSRCATKDSRARWSTLQIHATKQDVSLSPNLPSDKSGSHYFAARDTDSSIVRVNSLNPTNSTPEYEKFVFYRGVGNFSTPLKVTMDSENEVRLANQGQEPLRHLFVLNLAKQAGGFVYVDGLSPGEKRTVTLDSRAKELPLEALAERLGQSMEKALTAEGLYAREAAAMVKTWRDSWFEEEGVRVLYTLPRAWTDRTLPLTLAPAPKELVRVMLGRAEVLPPALQQRLSNELTKATAGEIPAQTSAKEEFRRLGRFAEPAVRLATHTADPATVQEAWNLLRQAQEKAADIPVTAAVASP